MKKVYLVGGAVRDELMGLTPYDLDYVVVGSTPEEMINEGFTQVGAEFPVFLHPETGDEYALARTEYRVGNGYQGFRCSFGPEVTLLDDLERRDLTINSMAKDLETGEIIDPFGGQKSIREKILTPTSDAFLDDPVRILRAGRFLARFPDYIASERLEEMRDIMAEFGDYIHLTPERVWQEMQKSLEEHQPSRFFEFLNGTEIFPEIEALEGVEEHNKWHPEKDVFTHVMMALDYSTRYYDPVVSFGVLCHDLGKPAAYKASGGAKSTRHEQLGEPIAKSFCERLRAPKEYASMAVKAAKYHTHVHLAFEMKPKTIYKLFKAFRNPVEFYRLLEIAMSDKKGRGEPACDWPYTNPGYLMDCHLVAYGVDSSRISGPMLEEGKFGPAIGEAIRRARIAAIAAVNKEDYNA